MYPQKCWTRPYSHLYYWVHCHKNTEHSLIALYEKRDKHAPSYLNTADLIKRCYNLQYKELLHILYETGKSFTCIHISKGNVYVINCCTHLLKRAGTESRVKEDGQLWIYLDLYYYYHNTNTITDLNTAYKQHVQSTLRWHALCVLED